MLITINESVYIAIIFMLITIKESVYIAIIYHANHNK